MIAVDTNILVYAFNADADWHEAAADCLFNLAASPSPWAVPWPCVHEFVAVVTSPRALPHPTAFHKACRAVEAWMASPSLRLIGESQGHWERLKRLMISGKLIGASVHDARIAAICLEHGVTELWTADRDFSRMSGLRARNPLI